MHNLTSQLHHNGPASDTMHVSVRTARPCVRPVPFCRVARVYPAPPQRTCKIASSAVDAFLAAADDKLQDQNIIGAIRQYERGLQEAANAEEKRCLLWNIAAMHGRIGDLELAQVRFSNGVSSCYAAQLQTCSPVGLYFVSGLTEFWTQHAASSALKAGRATEVRPARGVYCFWFACLQSCWLDANLLSEQACRALCAQVDGSLAVGIWGPVVCVHYVQAWSVPGVADARRTAERPQFTVSGVGNDLPDRLSAMLRELSA